MYKLSEQQIERILNDIRARGVKTESLQLNLLDHVCCIIEQELEPDGDFESFYNHAITKFYKNNLGEIEEEAHFLITYKNYYTMKKTMLITGGLSAIFISVGILFKFLQMPGAAINIVLGISIFSLLFLPLLFVLKVKENTQLRDRVIYALGTLAAILLSMGILFKIMYWPGANVMGITALIIMSIVFLPIYFFSGIRHAETKLNTIVSSVLIVAGCGLFLSLIRIPSKTQQLRVIETSFFANHRHILQTELHQLQRTKGNVFTLPQSAAINQLCETIQAYLLQRDIGKPTLPTNFNPETDALSDTRISVYLPEKSATYAELQALRQFVKDYNATAKTNKTLTPLPMEGTLLTDDNCTTTRALNDLTQMQLILVQNEREQLAL